MVMDRTPVLKWMNVNWATTELHPPKKPGDVGYDLETAAPTIITGHGYTDVPCGVAVHIPDGYWGLICARSSALAAGIVVHYGVIDAGYRGPLYARCSTIDSNPTAVDVGTRLAQLILLPAVVLPAQPVDTLTGSERGATGFGSTGGTA